MGDIDFFSKNGRRSSNHPQKSKDLTRFYCRCRFLLSDQSMTKLMNSWWHGARSMGLLTWEILRDCQKYTCVWWLSRTAIKSIKRECKKFLWKIFFDQKLSETSDFGLFWSKNGQNKLEFQIFIIWIDSQWSITHFRIKIATPNFCVL